jgi:hypothetical protein
MHFAGHAERFDNNGYQYLFILIDRLLDPLFFSFPQAAVVIECCASCSVR